MALTATHEELQELERKLCSAGVPHEPIVESDAPYSGQLVAIGVRPGPRKELRRWFSSFPLLR